MGADLTSDGKIFQRAEKALLLDQVGVTLSSFKQLAFLHFGKCIMTNLSL